MSNVEKKVIEGIEILKKLGLPIKQQNNRSSYTLLALLSLKPSQTWSNAKAGLIGIHEIIEFVDSNYNFKYAENSRESIRRQTIHQFEQAGLIVRNPDDPSRPTNSGKTVYSITKEALKTIQSFQTSEWEKELKLFNAKCGSLNDKYSSPRKLARIPLRVDGQNYQLSPGKHNLLQAAIINEFASVFAQNTEIFYLGDTAKKHVIYKIDKLEEIGFPITKHDKLPDVVLYHRQNNWVYLIEAVTSHGPVSPKRQNELKQVLSNCESGLIFVSAFPDFKTFNKYVNDIAWETEVWIAANPEHLIHYNGDKFMGPRK